MNDLMESYPREISTATPADILNKASEAAKVLKQMITQTKSSVKIGTSEHIKQEGWQTIGSIYHVTARTKTVEPCEINGVSGAHAIVDLVDDFTGNVIGSGQSFCMRDEMNRKNQPWFQLASMAQTRASSRAFANKFRWITVMAGYAPTPAEEMEGAEIPSQKVTKPIEDIASRVLKAKEILIADGMKQDEISKLIEGKNASETLNVLKEVYLKRSEKPKEQNNVN